MDAVEEIKQRLSVEEVVGDYLELKRAGRNMKALSPFTNEKTPSFMVSPEKQIWHDFSSQKGGDMFTFVMEMEGIDFKAALEVLARRANVDLSQYRSGDGRTAKLKKRIIEANQTAESYYHQTLAKNPKALNYLFKERRYNKEIIQKFKIGFAPSVGSALTDFMVKKGFSDKELSDAGLVSRRGNRTVDMFRGRIVLPLRDDQGQTVGFTGRIIGDGQPKYLNTPQTIAYDKSSQVFGFSMAKQAIREAGFSVVVEGNLDVVAAHMAGTLNVVAIAGTAMTKRHMSKLARLSDDVRLAFDNDSAGLQATLRAIPMAQEIGLSLSIINLQGGKDPDDIIKQSPAKWKQIISRSQYVVDWIIQRFEQVHDLKTSTGKKEYSTAALEVIKRLSDPVERDHYLNQLAKKLDTDKAALKEKLDSTKSGRPRFEKRAQQAQTDPQKHVSSYQDLLVGMMLRYPEVRDSLSGLKGSDFSQEWQQATVDFLAVAERKPIVKTPSSLQDFDTYVKIALFRTEELYGTWASNDLLIEAIGLSRRLLKDNKKLQKEQLAKAVADAEASGDDRRRQELLEEFDRLIKEK